MNEPAPEQQGQQWDDLLSNPDIAEIIRVIAKEEAAKQPRTFDEGDNSMLRFTQNQGYAGI